MAEHILKEVIITEELNGKRADQAVAALCPEYSRMLIKSWITSGQALLNGNAIKPRDKVITGQVVSIDAQLEQESAAKAQEIPLDIVFEDEHFLIVNKPAGLVVHPGAGNSDKTLVNALLNHAPSLDHLPRAGLVHRIDKDTTGLLIAAKTQTSYHKLVKALEKRDIKRHYEAVVIGQFISGGAISEPIGRHKTKRTHMAVIATGKPATTHYRIIEKFRNHTHLSLELETGRTHQIRVHMAHAKHPLVGDKTYSGRLGIASHTTPELEECLRQFPRQALHAKSLGLHHPDSNEWMEFDSKLPDDMQDLLQLLKYDTKKEQ